MNNIGTKTKLGILFTIIVIGLGVYLYDQGTFESKPNLSGAEITIPHDNSVLIIDESLQGTYNTGGVTEKITGLDDGSHILIVGSDGRYPWARSITTPLETERTYTPFLLKKNPDTEVVDAELDNVITPDQENPLVQENAELYIEESSIFMRWTGEGELPQEFCEGTAGCLETVLVFGAPIPVTAAEFLSDDRIDAVLFSAGNAVYVTDTADGEYKNIQPVYFSENAEELTFQRDGDSILVQENDQVIRVSLL
jgi:hypothetical protein